MPAKRSSSAPGDADKLIAHQARILKAPRIAEHYHRLAEQGRDAGWTLEDYLGAVADLWPHVFEAGDLHDHCDVALGGALVGVWRIG